MTSSQQQHPWERGHDRPWELVHEDLQGKLWMESGTTRGGIQGRHRRLTNDAGIVRGMLRSVVICIDLSQSCLVKDLKPNRLVVMVDEICEFIVRFHDENPLSTLGVICTTNAKAMRLVDISRNPSQTVQILRERLLSESSDYAKDVPSNLPSLKNSLILAKSMLDSSPTYTSKEFIMICCGTSVLDPGDVFVTMDKMRETDVKCSSIHVVCYMEVYKRLTECTRGKFGVARDKSHLRELLSIHLIPPPVSNQRKFGKYVRMGFPSQILPDTNSATASYCLSEDRIIAVPYFCPNCLSPTSYLPSTCRVCQLPLIASSHLARTYHHLYPVENFTSLPAPIPTSPLNDEMLLAMEITPTTTAIMTTTTTTTTTTTSMVDAQPSSPPPQICFGCGDKTLESPLKNRCNKCHNWFCDVCDEVIHDSLFACPGDL